jgi:YHS domain-containing protein
MSRIVRAGAVVAMLSVAVVLGVRILPAVKADEPAGRDIPPAFAPLEYLVGKWKGQATPKDSAQSFRGWPESHTWAWVFTQGKPTGMSVAIQGGTVLADGKLTFDPGRKRYRLQGTAPKPRGGPVAFEGALDVSGKLLVLDQVDSGQREASDAGGGAIRLSVRPNANFIRYTMGVDRKEPGAAQFHRTTDVGLTKEGESLAGGSTASERAKCIVTGGAATMTLTYQGQTFPICCSGCRDEFNENPEKYIKKASLMVQSRGKAKAGPATPAQVSRFEDAFSGDVADSPSTKAGGRSAKAAPEASPAKAERDEDAAPGEARSANRDLSATKKPGATSATSPSAARAAGLLRIGQNLEKSGKTDAALTNYKRIIKDYADTPAAKTARQRIQALQKP